MPGKCPKCGMNLEKVNERTGKNLYTCPMPEDNYYSHNPGECPKCGMELVPKE
jgi:Cu2+-exporting ATPase